MKKDVEKRIKWVTFNFDADKYLRELRDEEEDIGKTMIQGPFGIESVLDPFSESRQFNWVMGHTNFNIDLFTRDRILKTKGVEICEVITRYRFIVAPGLAFNKQDVLKEIENNVLGSDECEECDNMQTTEVTDELLDILRSDDKKFCLYIDKDGNDFLATEDQDNFDNMRAIYKEAQEKHGGQIYEE